MSLQGNLKDFSITNILPILKTENKTGILEVKNEEKTVRIGFVEGQVVYAHAGEEGLIGRLKETLVAGGMITLDGWRHLEGYAGSPDLLWTTLAKVVPPETASRLLRRQVTDTLFDLLRFKKGTYSFNAAKTVDYPASLINPMDVDFLLMEGCRIADEFSQLEVKLPKPSAVLRKAILSQEEQTGDKGKSLAASRNFADTLEFVVLQERGVEINEHENKVLSVMETPKPVRAILNSVDLSSFDASAAMLSLMGKHIVVEMSRRELAAADKPRAARMMPGYIFLAVVAAVMVAAGWHRLSYMHPSQMEAWKALSGEVNGAKARYELDGLCNKLEAFQFQAGKPVKAPDDLLKSGVATRRELTDPWGTPYRFESVEGGWLIRSVGEDRVLSADDVVSAAPITEKKAEQQPVVAEPPSPAPQ
ncbi:MAG: DUF4388 domain-containing protein [Nitrospinae bacterium]|nr:DUF4388 domain-containing protein [Nitrospinota bacterium]